MHTCPPPIDALEEWLEEYPSVEGTYGHLLLEQKSKICKPLIDALRPYFESAHLDAREHFHAEAGIDLHPDASHEGSHAQYPTCLPPISKSGLFGEVMIGLITESYAMVGGHAWSIPIFLFRFHADVGSYLFDLARNPHGTRQVLGRFGNDFIGVSLDANGAVVRLIAGEAKWRKTLQPSVVDKILLGGLIDDPKGGGKKIRSGKGIWYEINKDPVVPKGLRQLQRLLEECDPSGHAAAILSMDKALLLKGGAPIPRTDLILIVGNAAPTREKEVALVQWETQPNEYTAGNDLQVVEVVLKGGDELIETLYDSLWTEESNDA